MQQRLEEGGLVLDKRSRLCNDTGEQLRFKGGEIVNVFDKGTFSVQGKNQARVRELRPSDIQGLIYPPFPGTADETKVLLAKEMDKQGIHIDVGKLWEKPRSSELSA